jgi:putative PIN family toxin of toxin-antitoxin system
MTLRVVIDTNIWIRILLKGRVTLPILEAFNEKNFQLIISQVLFDEFHEVWNRPRLKKYIDINQALRLEKQSHLLTGQRSLVARIPNNCIRSSIDRRFDRKKTRGCDR